MDIKEVLLQVHSLMRDLAYSEMAVENVWSKGEYNLVVVLQQLTVDLFFLDSNSCYFSCKVSKNYVQRIPEIIKEWTK